MKKKSIIVLLAVCALALTGCNNSDYEEAVGLYENGNYDKAKAMFVELGEYEDSATMVQACDYAKAVELYEAEDYDGAIAIFETIKEYEDSSEYINNAEYKKIVKSAEENCVTSEWYEYMDTVNHVVYDKCLYDFIADLRDDVETNAFANELCEIYDELKLEEANDFVRDFIDFYVRQTCDAYPDVGFEFEEVSYLCKVGYDENDNIINDSENLNMRIVFVQVGEYTQRFPAYIAYKNQYDDRMLYDIDFVQDFQTGFEGDNDSGVWNSEWTYDELQGTLYEKMEMNEVNDILKENDKLISLIQDCYECVFKEYQEKTVNGIAEEQREEIEAKNAEPAIGMTKDEVTNGAWGYPDDKNIDEYEWGTEEQWVYDGKGYVYFEDGIVTAVQHR